MRQKRSWIVALVLALSTLLPWQTARADTYVVTNTNDSGPGSLRQAITDANNHLGPDTITFAAATDGTPIVLAGAAYENSNASGDLDILDGGDLTIQGNGAANTIIDGGGNDRVFDVCPGGGCANTVTFNGVTIQNGKSAGLGGGILNRGATLNVQNSTIGGATFGNEAVGGGGISTSGGGTTMVDGSTVESNTAYSGGGIYNYVGCTTTVNGSIVRDNDADGDGGGIYNNDGTLNVQNSTIGANDHDFGFQNHADDDGGGIYNLGTLTLTDSALTFGEAWDDGGGIYNEGTVTLNNSTVEFSLAGHNGGGICNWMGTVTLDNSYLFDNRADYGGGIYNHAALMLNNSTVDFNTADYGGGIYNMATLTLDNCTVSGNRAYASGGGIVTSSGLALNHTTIAFNWADWDYDGTGDGGGIYVFPDCTANVRNTIIGVNHDTGDEVRDCWGTLSSQGYNLVEDTTGCTFTLMAGDVTGLAPRLGALHDYGGPTYTHALQTGSPAIERIPNGTNGCQAGVSTDQRGYVRAGGPGNGGSSCDIGAYEYDTVPLAPPVGPVYLPIILKNH